MSQPVNVARLVAFANAHAVNVAHLLPNGRFRMATPAIHVDGDERRDVSAVIECEPTMADVRAEIGY